MTVLMVFVGLRAITKPSDLSSPAAIQTCFRLYWDAIFLVDRVTWFVSSIYTSCKFLFLTFRCFIGISRNDNSPFVLFFKKTFMPKTIWNLLGGHCESLLFGPLVSVFDNPTYPVFSYRSPYLVYLKMRFLTLSLSMVTLMFWVLLVRFRPRAAK